MKKLISMLLTLAILLGVAAPALAASVTVQPSATEIQAGEDVTLTLSLDETMENVTSLDYWIYYDIDLFSFKSYALSEKHSFIAVNDLPNGNSSDTKARVNFNYVDVTSNGVKVEAGTLGTITFTAKQDIAEAKNAGFNVKCQGVGDTSFSYIIQPSADDTKLSISISPAGSASSDPFTSVTLEDGTKLTAVASGEYDYYSYKGPLYKVTIPCDVDSVTVNMPAADTYQPLYRDNDGGFSGNGTVTGSTNSFDVKIDFNNNGKTDVCCVVQSDYVNKILFALEFVVDEDWKVQPPFSSLNLADGTKLTAVASGEYDYYSYKGPLYKVTVPCNVDSITVNMPAADTYKALYRDNNGDFSGNGTATASTTSFDVKIDFNANGVSDVCCVVQSDYVNKILFALEFVIDADWEIEVGSKDPFKSITLADGTELEVTVSESTVTQNGSDYHPYVVQVVEGTKSVIINMEESKCWSYGTNRGSSTSGQRLSTESTAIPYTIEYANDTTAYYAYVAEPSSAAPLFLVEFDVIEREDLFTSINLTDGTPVLVEYDGQTTYNNTSVPLYNIYVTEDDIYLTLNMKESDTYLLGYCTKYGTSWSTQTASALSMHSDSKNSAPLIGIIVIRGDRPTDTPLMMINPVVEELPDITSVTGALRYAETGTDKTLNVSKPLYTITVEDSMEEITVNLDMTAEWKLYNAASKESAALAETNAITLKVSDGAIYNLFNSDLSKAYMAFKIETVATQAVSSITDQNGNAVSYAQTGTDSFMNLEKPLYTITVGADVENVTVNLVRADSYYLFDENAVTSQQLTDASSFTLPVSDGALYSLVSSDYQRGWFAFAIKVEDQAPVEVPATSITIEISGISAEEMAQGIRMTAGEALDLNAALEPANSTDSIVWNSSNTAVAEVVEGKLYARGAGMATITAKAVNASGISLLDAEGDVIASFDITVEDAAIDGLTAALYEDQTVENGNSAQVELRVKSDNVQEVYNAFKFVLNYDASKLTYNSASFNNADNNDYSITDKDGTITIDGYGKTQTVSDANALVTLSFTAKATGSADVTITEAYANDRNVAISSDVKSIAIEDTRKAATITIADKAHTVAISGGTVNGGKTELKITENGEITITPDAKDGHALKMISVTNGSVKDNGDGTYTISGVTENTTLTISWNKVYKVKFTGSGASDATGASTAIEGSSYSFSVDQKDGYTYTISATMNGQTYSFENGYKIDNVSGDITITVNKSSSTVDPSTTYDVSTVLNNGSETKVGTISSADSSYSFNAHYDNAVIRKITVNGVDATWTEADGTYTINGSFNGNVVIYYGGVYNVSLPEGATGEANATYGSDYSFTVPANYDASNKPIVKISGSEITLADGVRNNDQTWTYTISGDQITGNIEISLPAVQSIIVDVKSYFSADNIEMKLVRAWTDAPLADGKVLSYDGKPMYWSSEYTYTGGVSAITGCYVWLVPVNGAFTLEDAKAAIVLADGAKAGSISYSCDVNATGNVDVNDAQLTYDIYNAEYPNFDSVSMATMLRADINKDAALDTQDVTAIVNTYRK